MLYLSAARIVGESLIPLRASIGSSAVYHLPAVAHVPVLPVGKPFALRPVVQLSFRAATAWALT